MGSYGNIELMFNTLVGKFGGFAGGSSGGLTFSYAPAQTGLTGLTVQKNDSNYWLIGGSHPGGDSPSTAPNSGFYVFTTVSDFTGRISMWGGGGSAFRVATVGGGGAYVQTTHTFSADNTYKAYVGSADEGTFIFIKGGPSPSTAFNPVDKLVVVAGGGGEAGNYDAHSGPGPGGPGGAGGYPSGAAGTGGNAGQPGPYSSGGAGGGGGTQSAVGAGGTAGGTNADGLPGAFIYQATGGSGGSHGRGGGGYYGGGGGEGGSYGGPNPGSGSGGGGGGGSSHANSAVTSSTTHSSGSANTAGGSPTRPNPSPYWGLQGGYGIGKRLSYTGGPTSPQYNSWAVTGGAKSAIFIDDVS